MPCNNKFYNQLKRKNIMKNFKLYPLLFILCFACFLSRAEASNPVTYTYYCSCTPVVNGCAGLKSKKPCCRCYEPGKGTPAWDANSSPARIGINYIQDFIVYCLKSSTGPSKRHIDTSHDPVNIFCENSYNSTGLIPSISAYTCENTDSSTSTMHINAFDCFGD